MRRFFCNEITGDRVSISGQEARHMLRVLRMQPGDQLVLFDGTGYDYIARIADVEGNRVRAEILKKEFAQNELDVRVHICQAVIKSDHFDYAVQKCTELGAHRILPFLSERCVKRPKDAGSFVAREQRIATEAAKQCGRSRIPEILPIVDFEELIADLAGRSIILAYEGEKVYTLKQLLQGTKKKDELYVVIGPEGGFSDREVEETLRVGAHSVSLGKLILRAETAGAAALAMIGYAYGK